MPSRAGVQAEPAGLQRELGEMLHDLCQPMTVLQCRLALAMMPEAGVKGEEELRKVIRESLQDCERLNARVSRMRELLAKEAE